MSLDQNTAFEEIQRIMKRHPLLVVGTGASCALDVRFGMPMLAEELRARVIPGSNTEKQQWTLVLDALTAKRTLEESLDAATEKGLENRIVAETGAFVARIDREWAWRVATGEHVPPLLGLLRKLVDGLPPTNPIQHVVTPNYDMVIEHTCDASRIPFTDGFVTGSTCRRDWAAASDAMLLRTREPRGKRWDDVTRYRPHIRLHKVHGSINWFEDDREDRLLRCDRVADADAPAGWRRAMITPGKSKLAKAGMNREWFKEADNAIAGTTVVSDGRLRLERRPHPEADQNETGRSGLRRARCDTRLVGANRAMDSEQHGPLGCLSEPGWREEGLDHRWPQKRGRAVV